MLVSTRVLAAQPWPTKRPPSLALHRYVPWLVVNGVPLGEDDVNLKKYICITLESGK